MRSRCSDGGLAVASACTRSALTSLQELEEHLGQINHFQASVPMAQLLITAMCPWAYRGLHPDKEPCRRATWRTRLWLHL